MTFDVKTNNLLHLRLSKGALGPGDSICGAVSIADQRSAGDGADQIPTAGAERSG